MKSIQIKQISDSKKEFLYSRIKYVLEKFRTYICAHNRDEIYELSKIIEKNIDNFKILENTIHDSDTYFFNKPCGVYNGLLLHKTFITKEINQNKF